MEKEVIHMNLQNRKRLTDLENGLMVARGKGKLGSLGWVMYTLLYLKRTTSKDLLYSIWNSAHCDVAAWMGGRRKENLIFLLTLCKISFFGKVFKSLPQLKKFSCLLLLMNFENR